MGNGGFSLDAPEFIPNVYASNGEMYTWVPNQVIKKCDYIGLLNWNSVMEFYVIRASVKIKILSSLLTSVHKVLKQYFLITSMIS